MCIERHLQNPFGNFEALDKRAWRIESACAQKKEIKMQKWKEETLASLDDLNEIIDKMKVEITKNKDYDQRGKRLNLASLQRLRLLTISFLAKGKHFRKVSVKFPGEHASQGEE